ncbi:beta-N-acetylhexosaminidase [Sphingorhabdus sp. Alg239-R122]|uniref:beta-N-acetylhexosaminidase n=1 Tax=Sphingorhabdus sp. Alg239-R122 TaxID=2305989 RepID=UPI0013D9E0F1|nr:beta-N-acetylhexosaminidase [Sphingorhabdus sp. Alg239-R122]
MKPVIFGLSGLTMTADERAFFAEADPAGYIIFGRNIGTHEQLRALTDSIRELHGRDDVLILIDQEGGRVARMQPPHWPTYPAGAQFDALYHIAPASAIEAIRLNAEAIALDLNEVGINVDCLPLLDVRQAETTSAIGDRALGSEPLRVAALGRATLDGLRRGGVEGIVKHMPGHGRAVVDSHMELPHVDADAAALESDIAPFKTLNDAPMAMTAHIVYRAWDDVRPATQSPMVIDEIIRGEIGFDGLLLSDDLDMKALKGDVPTRALKSVEAGCDIALNCWGRMDEMQGIADLLPEISKASKVRLGGALRLVAPDAARERHSECIAKRDELLELA